MARIKCPVPRKFPPPKAGTTRCAECTASRARDISCRTRTAPADLERAQKVLRKVQQGSELF